MQRKNISFMIKLVAMLLLAIAVFLPAFQLKLVMYWENEVPPSTEETFEAVMIELTPVGSRLVNITFDPGSQKFETEEIDPNDPFVQSYKELNLVFQIMTYISLLLIALSAVFVFTKGQSKLGGVFSLLGSVVLAVESLVIYGAKLVFIEAFESLGATVTNDVGLLSGTYDIGGTDYTLITEVHFILAIGFSLILAVAVINFISLFIRAEE